ncbi:Rieske (2Fe-2S) protein [Pedobacter sp. GR22-6]|uniref:Rieske (2Fe-2S) protein n=1 Tax=Pedobacter sp. GR22-6 TaxID=3127957 RepID=UPI00307F506B
MNWHKIETDIPEQDFVKQIQINGKKLCLLRHRERLFVVQNSCPHAGGILSGGWCRNGHLVCPIHRWEYNLENGRGAAGQGDYIDIYPIETREDGIYVGFRESWIKKLFRK